MAQYCRQIYYYETDRMSIVHNSNYLRGLYTIKDCISNEPDGCLLILSVGFIII